MKYCEKFYELAINVKSFLEEQGRDSWLVGSVKTPFGIVPQTICYTGDVLPQVHEECINMSMVLAQKLNPSDSESVYGSVYIDEEDIQGGIKWER